MHACLAAVNDLDFHGHATDVGFNQWQAWRELRQRNAEERAVPGALPDLGLVVMATTGDLTRPSIPSVRPASSFSLP